MSPAIVFCLFVALATSAGAVERATFEGLGTLPSDFPRTVVRGISADGAIVVGHSRILFDFDQSPTSQGFRWESGELTAISGLGDARGVSADGLVVVGDWKLWEDGVVSPLGILGNDVSADGSIVVGTLDHDAYRWEDGVLTSLFDPSDESIWSSAKAVSADGSVIVGRVEEYEETVTLRYEAYRWEDGVTTLLGELPGAAGGMWRPFSVASGVSADGRVVVGHSRSPLGRDEAFRWEDGVMEPLRVEPIGPYHGSFARDASEDGSVIVGYSETGAFIWDRASGIRELKQVLIDDYGLDLTGWILGDAIAVSDDGHTIAGIGKNPDGVSVGWRAVLLHECDDGIDNDGDGDTDFPDDPGCFDESWPREASECKDGIDNDGDLLTDMLDPGCDAPWDDVEIDPAPCGLGFELALLPPPLIWLNRRRRRRAA